MRINIVLLLELFYNYTYVKGLKAETTSINQIAIQEISQLVILLKTYTSGPFAESILAVKMNSRSDFSVITGREL